MKTNNIAQNNKRIAKNTLLLYFRMLLIMAVSLYTSRVVLDALGVEDYGTYNVVGGVVAMFGFITGPMSGATQRYITFSLGEGNIKELNKVFCSCINIYMIASLLLIITCEVLGVWFLYNKMQIPLESLDTAFWVLQCSLLTTIIMLMTVPYNADIIAHEKMSAFAYFSILEVILKLSIVFIIQLVETNRLILYAILIAGIQISICLCYIIYCRKHFEETKYKWYWNTQLVKEIASFAGWSLYGNLASVGFTQGLNILLNMFFGTVVNAARGIAVQVQSTVCSFSSNIQTAINPQITKSFASGNIEYMHILINKSSRLSFFMIYTLSLPILLETPYILSIWLVNVPEYTVTFIRLILFSTWIATLANPLIVSMLATGKIKRYQQIVGTILLTIVPISYLFLKNGFPPYVVYLVTIFIELIAHTARIIMLKKMINLSISNYIKDIITKIILVIVLSTPIPLLTSIYLQQSFINFIVVSGLSIMFTMTAIYKVGLMKGEKEYIKQKIAKRFSND